MEFSEATTVDALSMSRLESLLSRMSVLPLSIGRDRTFDRVHGAGNSAKRPRGTLNAQKDTTPVTTLQGYCDSISGGVILGHILMPLG